MATAADGRDWWTTILAGGAATGGVLSAAEHIQIAEETLAFSQRDSEANRSREDRREILQAGSERAVAHALTAIAITLNRQARP